MARQNGAAIYIQSWLCRLLIKDETKSKRKEKRQQQTGDHLFTNCGKHQLNKTQQKNQNQNDCVKYPVNILAKLSILCEFINKRKVVREW